MPRRRPGSRRTSPARGATGSAYLDRPAPRRGPPWGHNSVGASVHTALARWWELPRERRTPEAGGALLVRSWLTDGFRDRAQLVAARERARGQVERYLAGVDPDDEPIGVERTGGHGPRGLALWGRVDRLDDRPGEGVVVVDYKTGRSVLTVDDARSSLALAVYAAGGRPDPAPALHAGSSCTTCPPGTAWSGTTPRSPWPSTCGAPTTWPPSWPGSTSGTPPGCPGSRPTRRSRPGSAPSAGGATSGPGVRPAARCRSSRPGPASPSDPATALAAAQALEPRLQAVRRVAGERGEHLVAPARDRTRTGPGSGRAARPRPAGRRRATSSAAPRPG